MRPVPTYHLTPHPDHPPLAVRGVEVEVTGRDDGVRLGYRVLAPETVLTPERLSPARADELWRTTCFELFLRFDDDEQYVEFNFSPSTRWAAYAFDGYREGMTALDRDVDPRIQRRPDGVAVACNLRGLPYGGLAMALTAVIEETDGTKSYWSLAHPPGAPDFHHPACFVARLPAPAAQ
ncbi:DOMON-like domain-containing protein [Sphingomonas sp.]|uniref:DOMON-like domain-containing protein n=1 Tax=Sphingomonas sp. TaxID=28214 RepID=UPI003B00C3B8